MMECIWNFEKAWDGTMIVNTLIKEKKKTTKGFQMHVIITMCLCTRVKDEGFVLSVWERAFSFCFWKD